MGIFKPIGNFLFGKDPDIFDENGNVAHKHPKKKWDNWANKLKLDPTYNWRHHKGMQGGAKAPGPSTSGKKADSTR
jgi:hypothetical protein